MNTAIIAEYNPFHAGHAYLISELRRLGAETITAVMSGNAQQRGEFAVFDKFARARAAIDGGADLVIALPSVYSLQSAEGFARGAVGMITSLGVIDSLCFGAECGDLAALQRASEQIDHRRQDERIKAAVRRGQTYAKALQQLTEVELSPNNILAIEYLRAINNSALRGTTSGDRGRSPLQPLLIARGAVEASAHAERERIYARRPLADGVFDFERVELAARLKLKIRTSVAEYLQGKKSKCRTMASIKREFMRELLEITEEDNTLTPFAHVLAFNERGQRLLAQLRKTTSIPLSPNFARLARAAPRLAEIERYVDFWHTEGILQ